MGQQYTANQPQTISPAHVQTILELVKGIAELQANPKDLEAKLRMSYAVTEEEEEIRAKAKKYVEDSVRIKKEISDAITELEKIKQQHKINSDALELEYKKLDEAKRQHYEATQNLKFQQKLHETAKAEFNNHKNDFALSVSKFQKEKDEHVVNLAKFDKYSLQLDKRSNDLDEREKVLRQRAKAIKDQFADI